MCVYVFIMDFNHLKTHTCPNELGSTVLIAEYCFAHLIKILDTVYPQQGRYDTKILIIAIRIVKFL